MPPKHPPPSRQRVDVRRVDVVLPETFEFGPQVINAEQQNVRLFGSAQGRSGDDETGKKPESGSEAERHGEPVKLRFWGELRRRVAKTR